MPLPTCRIDWRALSSVVDGDDPDRDPDIVPLAHLSVKFTPGLARIVTTSPPETVFLHPIEWETDENGYLVSPNGQRGLYLIASDIDPENIWTWTVRISSTPTSPHQITAVSYSFVAPSGGIIDLSTVIPVPAVPARDLPAWQEAVNTTLAAEAHVVALHGETAAHASAAAASATTAQTAATTATNAATTAAIGGFLSGTGSPQGVVAAPVGSQYRDTAATNGAVIWVKASGTGTTGWVVQYGDTGWRDITSLRDPMWGSPTTAPIFRIRREGNRVSWQCRMTVPAGSPLIGTTRSTARLLFAFPAGFAPDTYTVLGNAFLAAAATGLVLNSYSLGQMHIHLSSSLYAENDLVTASGSWVTSAAWPTTLPGTPTS